MQTTENTETENARADYMFPGTSYSWWPVRYILYTLYMIIIIMYNVYNIYIVLFKVPLIL